jgi:hypothetical protein
MVEVIREQSNSDDWGAIRNQGEECKDKNSTKNGYGARTVALLV